MKKDASEWLICHNCNNPAHDVCDSTPDLCGRGRDKQNEKQFGKKRDLEGRLIDRKNELLYNNKE